MDAGPRGGERLLWGYIDGLCVNGRVVMKPRSNFKYGIVSTTHHTDQDGCCCA